MTERDAEREAWLAHAIAANILCQYWKTSEPVAREELARHIAKESWVLAHLLAEALEAECPARQFVDTRHGT